MTIIGYDSTTAVDLPANGDFYLAYINGRYANLSAVKARFPHKPVFSIAVSDNADADVLDIEPGNATPQQAPGWAARQVKLGRPKPILYASQSDMPAVLAEVTQAGIRRANVRLLTAHYGNGLHICSPSACGAKGFTADATQWSAYPGESPGHYDITVALASFLDITPPAPVNQEADDMVIVFHSPDGKTALAAVPGCGLVGVSSAAQAEAMYPGFHDAKPTAAEWADVLANYHGQKATA